MFDRHSGLGDRQIEGILNQSDLDEEWGECTDNDDAIFMPQLRIEESSSDTVSSSSDGNEAAPTTSASVCPRRVLWKHSESFDPDSSPEFIESHVDANPRTASEYFKRYIDDDFFETVAINSNQWHLKKTGTILNTTQMQIKKFFGASIYMSCLKYPRIRMYWARRTKVNDICSNLSRDNFFKIRANIKLAQDDETSSEEKAANKYWRILPLLNRVRDACLNNPRSENIAIDEQMIPFWGRVFSRQCLRNKPNPTGLKNFVAAAPDGLPLDFFLYEGKGDSITKDAKYQHLGIGGKVVMRLSQTLPQGVHIFIDRYFTSVKLLDALRDNGMKGTGTIQNNQIPKESVFKTDLQLKRLGRGSCDQLIRSDKKVCLIKWLDNKPVKLASTHLGREPSSTCRRWDKKDKVYRNVFCPDIIKQYNVNMGGIDLLDRIISHYRISAKTRKWTIRVIYHLFDFAIASSWIEYRRDHKETPKKDQLDYLDFRLRIADYLLYPKDFAATEDSDETSLLEPSTSCTTRRQFVGHPPDELRTMSILHLPEIPPQKNSSRCRMKGCKSTKARVRCTACKLFLCLTTKRNCFLAYHKP